MVACYVQPWVGLSRGSQIVAARDLLEMTQEEFAAECGVSPKTLGNFEKYFRGRVDSLMKIQATIERLRVELIDDERGIGAIVKPREPRKKR
jgi:DNA-binding XRE family transcriptional regulator